MLLVSNDERTEKDENVDDKLGESVNIPTIIMKRSDGQLIKEAINNSNEESIVLMSVKFTSLDIGEKLNFELFMRSDDIKALHFFKEFEQYFQKMSKLILTLFYFRKQNKFHSCL